MNRLRILASAFTCCPPGKPGFTGGEDTLGWNMLIQLARFNEVWALTNAEDQPSVESGMYELGLTNIHFQFVGLPKWMSALLRFQGFHQFYYLIWQIKAYLVSRRLRKEVHFDLFHHITYANDWMASLIGAFSPIPYIRGPGGGAHRTPKNFESEYKISGRIWEKIRAFGQWLFRHEPIFMKGQSKAQAILVCNNEALNAVSSRWTSKTAIFPVSGLSESDCDGEDRPLTDGQFRVLTAGSLIRIKGFGLAIRGFQEFARHHPEAHFSIVGSGPEEERLKSIANKSGIASQIHFLGELTRDQLLDRMRKSDIFLFPSLRDGGGTVVVEAMGAGKPVICMDTGGPAMHVTQQCGFKIAPVSPSQAVDEIAAALEVLHSNEELRYKMGISARNRAKELYLWDKLGDRMYSIYGTVLNQELVGRSD